MNGGLVLLLLASLFEAPTPAHTDKDSRRSQTYTIASRAVGPMEIGKPLDVAIKVTNISDGPLTFRSDSFYPAYSYYRWSLTHTGVPVETTAFHRMLFGHQREGDPIAVASGSHMFSSIPPKEGFEMTVDLNKMFSINEPGQYLLQVELRGQTGGDVKSNILSLNVKP